MSFDVKHYDGDLNANPKEKDDTATPKDIVLLY
jgi:hypothetical protein